MGEPVAWTGEHDGVSVVDLDELKSFKEKYAEGTANVFTVPLYRLPEGVPKFPSILNVKVTGAETGKPYKLSYFQNGSEDKEK